MFTGIIKHTGTVADARAVSYGTRLSIEAAGFLGDTELSPGASVSINGVCLTVTQIETDRIVFDVIPETLARSTLGSLRKGARVNLESSLRAGDPLDGHFVQGHIDGTGRLTRRETSAGEQVMWFETDAAFAPYLIPKGSIAVDGISLTIAEVKGSAFSVALVPTTLDLTTLGDRKIGDRVNLESDVITRTVIHRLGAGGAEGGLTMAKLEAHGFA